jgi:D-alanyl-D-alanine carboxypeptidase (penicillin-binding protein 4)
MWFLGYISEVWIERKNCEIYREAFSDEYIVPASTLKSLWALILLNDLGKDHRIPTLIGLKGDTLILRFNGDPTLKFSTLSSIIKEKNLNFENLNVIISFPKWGERYGYGWAWEDVERGLVSPITPVSINYGTVSPDSSLRILLGQVNVEVFTDSAIFIPHPNYRYRDPLSFIKHIVKVSSGAKRINFIVLEGNDINLEGYQIDTLYSPTLLEILRPTLSFSINFLSDMLAAYYSGGLSRVGERFSDFAKRLGIENKPYIFDGSGLSRYNLIKAVDAVMIMCKASKNLGDDVLGIFPSPGEGTLSNRLRDLRDKIYAKTGTLFGVSALMGFYKTCKGDYVFGIFVQNYPITKNAREEIDEMVRAYEGLLDCAQAEAK